ncbi:MAG: hypothetical protein J0M12_17425 [Deltaproteobacteria bacterium]|nr:hypothetical protein [Deltaproteobacteria bacterium]
MNISEISAQKSAEVKSAADVSLQKGAGEQLKAVAKTIFEGIAQTPPPESGSGHKLNKVA